MTEANGPKRSRQKSKKSFWFEYAEKKGVDPHKSAWREYTNDEKEKREKRIRYCRKCGAQIIHDGKFCERCGQPVRSK